MRAFLLGLALALLAATSRPRVVVYSYAYATNETSEAPEAYGVDKMDPGGGGTFMFRNVNQHYRSPSFDGAAVRKGTIGVQILHADSNGGLVLSVSEPAATSMALADTTTCVVFADTTVVCDPSRTVSPEALTLLRFLGPNFMDASRLDSNRHWHAVSQGNYATTADYTIGRMDGTKFEINEAAIHALPGRAEKTELAATIDYDAARSLPLAVDESTVEHDQRGVVAQTTTTHVVLTLLTP